MGARRDRRETATLDVESSVITGFTPALRCAQSGGGAATLRADYSGFGTPVATAGGCAAPAAAHNLAPFAAPGFVTTGFEPRWDSPLIDRGNPGAVFLPRAIDLDGLPRVVGQAGWTSGRSSTSIARPP